MLLGDAVALSVNVGFVVPRRVEAVDIVDMAGERVLRLVVFSTVLRGAD